MVVSFAIVAYNEEKTLPRLLEDLKNQDYPHEKIEVLLIDSMSTDKTGEIMASFAAEDNGFLRVLVLKNPGKNIPCGHNVALDHYTGDALVRVDAHASCPKEFVRKNVQVLESGEMVCGGSRPNIIDDSNPWKQTLLTAEQSMFGSSVAPYRNGKQKTYTKSLFCGMYRREVYDKVGRYNELLPRSEDNDMTCRVREAGYRLCYDPDIVFYQHTRSTLPKMLRQKYLNGYWIGKTMGINPRCFSLFHFVPFAFVMGILGTAVLAVLGVLWPLWIMWAAYCLLTVGISVMEFIRKPLATHLLLPLLFLGLHVSYGVGTLVGLIEMPFWVKGLKKGA